MKYDVIVLGAGAAGLMAAGSAASEGKSVLLLEKMEKAGRKIRITGKGKCNVTNTKSREEFLLNVNAGAEFFTPAFYHFDNQATINLFKEQGVILAFERGDRVFPESGKAWDIANALIDWAEDCGAKIQYHTRATEIRTIGERVVGIKIENRRGFGRNLETDNVIIATGGVSYPATGSTGDGYGMAYGLGHEIVAIRPALVPLESDSALADALRGVDLRNVNVKLVIDGEVVREEFGEIGFGTRGVEGPVVLAISRMAVDALIAGKSVALTLDIKNALSVETLAARIERERAALGEEKGEDARIEDLMRKLMPKPMIVPLAKEIDIDPDGALSALTPGEVARLIGIMKNIVLPISDYRPFEEAVITAGGVSVDQIDPETLQSKLIKGLYFAGEVLDIDANTGGYNLQIAFSTGHLAGKLRGV